MTRTSTDTILKLTDLRVEALSGAVLVDNVSLELKRGEVVGLIGESGAGKSTIGLASMVYARAGCRITGGKVEIAGEDVRQLDAGRRLHVLRRDMGHRAVAGGADVELRRVRLRVGDHLRHRRPLGGGEPGRVSAGQHVQDA
mgnify:CR=1 FL=1